MKPIKNPDTETELCTPEKSLIIPKLMIFYIDHHITDIYLAT